MIRISTIDSHTGGEPTRVVVGGLPDLGSGSVAERARVVRDEYDSFRTAVVCEPRGSDVLVGALLLEPSDPSNTAGVVFFNNVGMLGMCGHGTIGLIATLAHMGRIGPGEHRIETPVGVVTATLCADGSVTVMNVPSYRVARDITVDVPDCGWVMGDVAWGGNWFFLVGGQPWELRVENVDRLADLAARIRTAVNAAGFPEVDHVELFGPPQGDGADSRNLVLCPGNAYDRSPCGTGTSAKLACLAADGKLAEGAEWVQESILGARFSGRFRWLDRAAGTVLPEITGQAHVNGECLLILQNDDPYQWGIRKRRPHTP